MALTGEQALAIAKKYTKETAEGMGAIKGEDGFSPIITENSNNTETDYRLDITDAYKTFTTPNLHGADGTGGEENVQSDWNETDTASDAYIKNKPTIPSVDGLATIEYVDNAIENIPETDLSDYYNKEEVNNLIPTVPTKVSELENDKKYISSIPEEYVTETELNAKGYITDVIPTTDRTLTHSHAGGLKIESVAGESVQESTTGAQLFDYKNISWAVNVNSCESVERKSNGIHFIINKKTASSGIFGGCKLSSSMFISFDVRFSSLNFGNFRSENIFTKNSSDFKSGEFNHLEFPITSNIDTLTFYVDNYDNSYDTSIDVEIRDIMINRGSTPLPWEPYTGGIPSPSPSYPQEIKSSVVSEIKMVGAQLFDITNVEAGSYSSTSGSPEDSEDLERTKQPICVSPSSSYTATFTNDNGEIAIRMFEYDKNMNFIRTDLLMNGTTFITSDDTFYINMHVSPGFPDNTMINKGEIALHWEPYQESTIHLSSPITLHGIGTAKDRIVKKNGVWGVERNIASKRIDPNAHYNHVDGWADGTFVEYAFFSGGIRVPTFHTSIANALCTHAKIDTPAKIAGGVINAIGQGDTNGISLFLNFENCTTVDALREFLTNNEVYVYFQLATPTFEPLPTADQISLNSLATYDTVTYLSTDSEIEPVIEVEYGTSKVGGYTLEALNTAQRNEIRLSAIEAAQANTEG